MEKIHSDVPSISSSCPFTDWLKNIAIKGQTEATTPLSANSVRMQPIPQAFTGSKKSPHHIHDGHLHDKHHWPQKAQKQRIGTKGNKSITSYEYCFTWNCYCRKQLLNIHTYKYSFHLNTLPTLPCQNKCKIISSRFIKQRTRGI